MSTMWGKLSLTSNQISIRYTHKLCATMTLAQFAGIVDQKTLYLDCCFRFSVGSVQSTFAFQKPWKAGAKVLSPAHLLHIHLVCAAVSNGEVWTCVVHMQMYVGPWRSEEDTGCSAFSFSTFSLWQGLSEHRGRVATLAILFMHIAMLGLLSGSCRI